MEKHNIKAGRRVKRWRENHVQVMQVKKTLSITTNHLLFALSIGTASLLFEVGCLSEKSMNWPQQEYLTIPGWLWSDIRSGLMWATHIVLPSHLTVPLPANYQASSHNCKQADPYGPRVSWDLPLLLTCLSTGLSNCGGRKECVRPCPPAAHWPSLAWSTAW